MAMVRFLGMAAAATGAIVLAAPAALAANPIVRRPFMVRYGGGPEIYLHGPTFHVGGHGPGHMWMSPGGARLYVTRGTYTAVINTKTGQTIAKIKGAGADAIALVTRLRRGFIGDGKSDFVSVFNTKTDAVLGKIPVGLSPDRITDDPASKTVLVFGGKKDVMIPIDEAVDPARGKAGKRLALGGRPGYAVSDHKGRVYVDLVDKNLVDVIDTKTMKIIHRYPLGNGKHPAGMAMDRKRGVLFVGCRNRRMIVLNARTGKILTTLPIGAGVGGVAFDGQDALAACGSGVMTMVGQPAPGRYTVSRTIQTEPGARTMAFANKHGMVYLGVASRKPMRIPIRFGTQLPAFRKVGGAAFHILVLRAAMPM